MPEVIIPADLAEIINTHRQLFGGFTMQADAAPDAAIETPTPDVQEAYVPPATQADLDRIIETRLARERAKYVGFDEFKQKAARFDQQAEAAKTELEKAQERASAAEKTATQAANSQMRLEVAVEKGLTLKQAGRLVGSTKEELLADADEMLAEIKPAQPQPGLRIDPAGAQAGPINDKDAQARAFFGL